MIKDSHKKSMLKSIVWRIIGILWLAGIVWIFTHNWFQTTIITFIHHGIFLILFYLHERAWLNSKIKPKIRYAIKAFTYEIILGNVILGLITYTITGDIKQMTIITITYTLSKLLLYYFYDWMWSKKGKVVYAYVVADILHLGHLKHLKRSKQQGDYLIVGVLTDNAVMEKKSQPVMSIDERLELINSLSFVDKAIPQYTYSPLENVKKYKPDILMESSDHDEQPANEYVEKYGGKVIQSPYYKLQSSSKIKKKIKYDKKICQK